MTVMNFQLVAILGQQRRPVFALGNGRKLLEWRLRLLIRHFKKQQKCELFNVIAVGQTVIAENVAVVPEFLDELVAHSDSLMLDYRSSSSLLEPVPERMSYLRSVQPLPHSQSIKAGAPSLMR